MKAVDVVGLVSNIISLLLALAGLVYGLVERRQRHRQEEEARRQQEEFARDLERARQEADRDLLEARKRFDLELEAARERRAEAQAAAERLMTAERERRERVRLVAATWGNDEATSGDLNAPGEYGALVHNGTKSVIRYAHVTVRRRQRPDWVSKKDWLALSPESRTKWAARRVYAMAGAADDHSPSDWEQQHQVEVTFLDADNTFWLYDGNDWKELPSNLVIWAESSRARALRDLIEDGFVPDYGVHPTFVEFARIEDLQGAFEAVRANPGADPGAVPDVLVGPHDWLGRVVGENDVETVGLSQSQRASFHPKALTALSHGGRLYGIPYVFDSVALVRNTGLTGTGPLPVTFDELIDHGESLREQGDIEQPVALQVGDDGDPYHLWPLFSSAGGTLFGLRADGGFDEPEIWMEPFVEALRRIGELGEAGRGVLRRSVGRDDGVASFAAGRTPYLVCASRALTELAGSRLRYDVSPVPPLGSGPAISLVSVYGFFINRHGANRRIAEDLVTHFLARTDTGEHLVQIQPRPPVQVDAMRRASESDPRLATYINQCMTGQVMPKLPNMRELWSLLGQAQTRVIAGADARTVGEQVAYQGWALVERQR